MWKNAAIQQTNFNFELPDMSSVQYERYHGNKEEQYHTITVLVKYRTCNWVIITINKTIVKQKSCRPLHFTTMRGESHTILFTLSVNVMLWDEGEG